jgi:hypothetical protein
MWLPEELMGALGTWPGAVLLQRSGTAYLLVSAAHILGVGLLVGAILPLDLRLLGFFRSAPLAVIEPFLTRAAATGLALALVTGFWLFTVKPVEYLGNEAFLIKGALLAAALVNIALRYRIAGFARAASAFSLLLWLGVLVAGRWIGFV